MADIITKTEEFVFNLFKEHLPATCLYHNFTHTERVLSGVKEIIENSPVTAEESVILQLTALLHDTGYTKTREDHEEESVKIATSFLQEQQVDNSIIEAVNKCIMATKHSGTPTDELDKTIRDADTSHFGKPYFNETSEFLRKELEFQNIKQFSTMEWCEENIELLSKKHQFYTDYAKKNWQPIKEAHLNNLISIKNKHEKKIKTEQLKAKYKAQYKNENPDRGVQTFYRVALRNHIKLSDIADTKANILLSVNAIIISLVLSNLISKLDSPSNSYLIIPTVIFMFSSVLSMILSVLATRPNVTSGKFTKEDVEKKNVNLAFFGNYHKMELKDFEWAIGELIKDKDYMYSTLTKDLYYLGKVLDRKYNLLRLTYNCFMVGTIISVLAFAIASNGQTKTKAVKKKDNITYNILFKSVDYDDKSYAFKVSNKSS